MIVIQLFTWCPGVAPAEVPMKGLLQIRDKRAAGPVQGPVDRSKLNRLTSYICQQ